MFKRGDRVVLYKMDDKRNSYKEYVGMAGVVERCEQVVCVVLFDNGVTRIPFTHTLRLVHGPCPMEAA